ncbi:hypothetical protein B6A42_23960 [Vibrio coralliilyticus]|nr:hypothetical protein B6A42_23960 [Vibrio coralliilyticus]
MRLFFCLKIVKWRQLQVSVAHGHTNFGMAKEYTLDKLNSSLILNKNAELRLGGNQLNKAII